MRRAAFDALGNIFAYVWLYDLEKDFNERLQHILLKLTPEGEIVWMKAMPAQIRRMWYASDRLLAIGGWYLRVYDTSGRLLRESVPTLENTAAALNQDGMLYVASAGHAECALAAYDSLLQQQWTTTVSLPSGGEYSNCNPTWMVAHNSGSGAGVYIGAYSLHYQYDFFVIKVALDGTRSWVQSYENDLYPFVGITDILPADNGSVVATGESATIRYNAKGDVQWKVRHNRLPYVSIEEGSAPPAECHLSAVYPNPVRHQSHATPTLREPQHVRVEVVDVLGRTVTRVHEGVLAAGQIHRFNIEASGLASGLHLLRVIGSSFTSSEPFVVVH